MIFCFDSFSKTCCWRSNSQCNKNGNNNSEEKYTDSRNENKDENESSVAKKVL